MHWRMYLAKARFGILDLDLVRYGHLGREHAWRRVLEENDRITASLKNRLLPDTLLAQEVLLRRRKRGSVS
jgi:hypothetical protein